jgi:hypothetical protein
MARVEVFGNGSLHINNDQGSVIIGSIEGTGNVVLGNASLTVGSNNLSTIFSGVIQAPAGFNRLFTKIGSGILTFQGRATHNYIADTVSLSLVSGSIINLNFSGTPDIIGSLIVNGVVQMPGVYGGPASGAPHQLPEFAGTGTVQVGGAPTSTSRYDFNGDGHPDYLLYNASTRGTAVWYLNNNVYLGGTYAPILGAGWALADVADFNGDGHPDYALFNPSTRQTAIAYLSGVTLLGTASGPTLPSGWELVATGDFNNDGKPDYVLYNASSHQTAIWYLNNNVYVNGGYGPTLPVGWQVVGVADFDLDGHADYLLFNPSTRQSAIWYMSGRTLLRGVYGPAIASGYELTGAADFNGDSKPDYALFNASTGRTAIWYLNNNVYIGGAYGPTLPAGWSLVAP